GRGGRSAATNPPVLPACRSIRAAYSVIGMTFRADDGGYLRGQAEYKVSGVSTNNRTILANGLALAVATAAQLAAGQAFRPAAAADAQTPAPPAGAALTSTAIVDVLDGTTPFSTAEGAPAASPATATTAAAEPTTESAALETPPATV